MTHKIGPLTPELKAVKTIELRAGGPQYSGNPGLKYFILPEVPRKLSNDGVTTMVFWGQAKSLPNGHPDIEGPDNS